MHPWDIYAQELAFHGQGHPLWRPEPSAVGWTVQVGDVGWLRNGAFRHLLRTMCYAGDDQPHGVVPEHFTLLEPEELYILERRQSIQQRVLTSLGIRDLVVQPVADETSGRTSPFTEGRTTATFNCERPTGALLALSDTHEQRIESRLRIARFMLAEHARWLSFANDTLGLDLKPEDIVFVSAATTTPRWAVAAYEHNDNLEGGSFTFDYRAHSTDPLATRLAFSNSAIPRTWWRCMPAEPSVGGDIAAGPRRVQTDVCTSQPYEPVSDGGGTTTTPPHVNFSGPSSTAPAPSRYDQCVFIRFLKIKRRYFLPSRIVAAAGPDDLPGPENDSAGGRVVPVEGAGNGGEGDGVSDDPIVDPLDCLLDYILEHSSAEIAIASHSDLYAIFEGRELPVNMSSALVRVAPRVEVDELGGG
ncbi:hypothetical protein C8Q78DRAFT_1077546 [Trametes maxima]|nr:hypothetical protein C8Q78DRAFT_1077546 [Trametes maxima]